jgi:hypothetical protein
MATVTSSIHIIDNVESGMPFVSEDGRNDKNCPVRTTYGKHDQFLSGPTFSITFDSRGLPLSNPRFRSVAPSSTKSWRMTVARAGAPELQLVLGVCSIEPHRNFCDRCKRSAP